MADPHRQRTPSIFLSYAKSDRGRIEKVINSLKTSGANVWLDTWELQHGDSIFDRVDSAVRSSDVFLVFLSRASTASQWVSEELNAALSQEMNDRAITIVPVLLEDCVVCHLTVRMRPFRQISALNVRFLGAKFGVWRLQIWQ